MTHETREQLEDVVFDAYPTLDMDVIESMPVEELRHLLDRLKPEQLEQVEEPKQSPVKRSSVKVEPQTLEDAFVVSNGRLMRRMVTRHTLGQFVSETVHLAPTGERVSFAGRTYRATHLMHYLKTGQWVLRIDKRVNVKRHKAQVRVGARVLHLGYFASQEERDAAVLSYRLGITPSK